MIDFSNIHVLVIGDIMLDEFIYGTSTRQSPEFDAPVILPNKILRNGGGAANVLQNLVALKAKATLISAIGNDLYGNQLIECLPTQTEYLSIIQSPNIKTIKKTRLYNDDLPICRLDEEEKTFLNEQEKEDLKKRFDRTIESNQISAVLIQDYNKGILTEEVIKHIMESANAHQVPVFVDPKYDNYSAYSGCKIFKPNFQELSHFLGFQPEKNVPALDAAAEKLRQYVGYDTLILTLSEKGAYFSSEIGSGLVSTKKIEQADVCGAGDTFISTLCMAMALNKDLKSSIQLANKAATIVCQRAGVQVIKYEEIFNNLSQT